METVQYTFASGMVASLIANFVSEIGDKTFFIAAIMSMRASRTMVFAGAMSANTLMLIISGALGIGAHIVSPQIFHYISIVFFAIVGLKTTYSGFRMKDDDDDEYEEAEEELEKKKKHSKLAWLTSSMNQTFVEVFALTFFAEWADRSQLATVVLSSRESFLAIVLGGIIGQAISTGVAVVGGQYVAKRISAKIVTIIGGVVFLLFALFELFFVFY